MPSLPKLLPIYTFHIHTRTQIIHNIKNNCTLFFKKKNLPTRQRHQQTLWPKKNCTGCTMISVLCLFKNTFIYTFMLHNMYIYLGLVATASCHPFPIIIFFSLSFLSLSFYLRGSINYLAAEKEEKDN